MTKKQVCFVWLDHTWVTKEGLADYKRIYPRAKLGEERSSLGPDPTPVFQLLVPDTEVKKNPPL